jgi:diketogulonate reductase-like aldo/keto reductase
VQRDEVFLTTSLEACEQRGLTLEAYSPLTTGARLDDPRVAAVARRHGPSRALESKRW